MKPPSSAILESRPASPAAPAEEPIFGVNEMRLTARQWLAALAIVAIVLAVTPRLWKHVERFETPPDYRIPYALSNDYFLYAWRCEKVADPGAVIVLGDSVVWGEYVAPDGTISHFLGSEGGHPGRFVNCGVNGLFPLAMEGLVEHYGQALRNRRVIVHCNVLWVTSPKADLSASRVQSFNHSRLVPQFSPRIPCYGVDASERISVIVERNVPFSSWVGHLQAAYYDQKSIPMWTLEQEGDPPRLVNAFKNPLSPITLKVPGDPDPDPMRGPHSPRHVSWQSAGETPSKFDWVDLDRSMQWRAFQRTVELLRRRGNDVMVVVGPFNEHMVAPSQRAVFYAIRDGIGRWLESHRVPHVIPPALPSDLYADASHPLTEGYALLARRIFADEGFKTWLAGKHATGNSVGPAPARSQ